MRESKAARARRVASASAKPISEVPALRASDLDTTHPIVRRFTLSIRIAKKPLTRNQVRDPGAVDTGNSLESDPLPRGLSGPSFEQALLVAPFHSWLQLRVLSATKDGIELEFPWRDEAISNPRTRTVHGGVLASLVDLAGMYAILAQTTSVAATADLHVDYLRPATNGPIRVRAQVIKLGRTVSVAATDLLDDVGLLVAKGRGSYLMRPTSQPPA
jgi:uncharacterized protein (TIGR00369 family)